MEPSYLALYRTGELEHRSKLLEARLSSCDICPRECHVNRKKGERGFCLSGYWPIVSSICDHHGEEPAISGTRGTGAIFFGNCNMRCVYCQNFQISQNPQYENAQGVDFYALAQQMVYLQDEMHCHSISFISPSHFVPQMVQAVCKAVPMGLKIPLIYNTNAYDSLETIRALEGIIDVYLPDLKYASDVLAKKFSFTDDYVLRARQAITEMFRQVGEELILDSSGLVQRGLIVRHLVLPENIAGSRESLEWLARNISPRVMLSIMSQYYPAHFAIRIPELRRRISLSEYLSVLEIMEELDLSHGWIQEMDAADNYLPDFHRKGHPFLQQVS
jgi:putative pyruvate formate lyase activating enzyme